MPIENVLNLKRFLSRGQNAFHDDFIIIKGGALKDNPSSGEITIETWWHYLDA